MNEIIPREPMFAARRRKAESEKAAASPYLETPRSLKTGPVYRLA